MNLPAASTAPTTVDEVIARLQAIESALPASDGVACFNRMYLEVTLGVADQVKRGVFADSTWLSRLDVVFANRYLAAIGAVTEASPEQPSAWQPLLEARSNAGIEPIQFALAGMNIHINYDLPLAVVATCAEMDTAPTDAAHHSDYQHVDALLDAAEQSVRESFEPADVRQADQHVAAVTNVLANWSLNEARDVAWDTALALWAVRDNRMATDLLVRALARIVGLASRAVLVAL